jgi:hypothetical protein
MSEEHRPIADTKATLDGILQQYGSRLTPTELEEVRKGVEGLAQMTAVLRQMPLANSDEPCAVFVPYRQED